MKKILLFSIIGLSNQFAFAQNHVGINVDNPNSTLHVAGEISSLAVGAENQNLVNPTIRVEKLNAVNSPENFETADVVTTPLNITEDGVLVAGKNIEVKNKNFTDNLPFVLATNSVVVNRTVSVVDNLVISKASIVHIQVPVSVTLTNAKSTSQEFNQTISTNPGLANGVDNKRVFSYLMLTNAADPSNPIITGVADNFLKYRASKNGAGSRIPIKVVSETYIKLAPGTYNVQCIVGYDAGAESRSPSLVRGFLNINPDAANNNYSITVYPI